MPRNDFLSFRLSDLNTRCAELTKMKRGHSGPPGVQGPPGRDGLSGLPGRDGPAGRDGRDCPCQRQEYSPMLGESFQSAFAGRSKRTVEVIPVKNVTFVRFGKSSCPDVKAVSQLKHGRISLYFAFHLC